MDEHQMYLYLFGLHPFVPAVIRRFDREDELHVRLHLLGVEGEVHDRQVLRAQQWEGWADRAVNSLWN
jgi:hypothetical protein